MSVRPSLSETPLADLTDVTLADEDTKLIPTDNVNMVDKFATNARGAMLLLDLIQVTESISGSVVPLAMFSCHLTAL